MLETAGVRGPTLASSATVSVLLSIRNIPALRIAGLMFQTSGLTINLVSTGERRRAIRSWNTFPKRNPNKNTDMFENF